MEKPKTIHLEPGLHKRLRLRAVHQNISMRQLIHELLEKGLQHGKTTRSN